MFHFSCFDILSKHFTFVQGVCMGLSEVMGSAGKYQLVSYMGELIPTIRKALCDRSVNLIIEFSTTFTFPLFGSFLETCSVDVNVDCVSCLAEKW